MLNWLVHHVTSRLEKVKQRIASNIFLKFRTILYDYSCVVDCRNAELFGCLLLQLYLVWVLSVSYVYRPPNAVLAQLKNCHLELAQLLSSKNNHYIPRYRHASWSEQAPIHEYNVNNSQNTTKFIATAGIQYINYNSYMFRPFLVAIIRLYILVSRAYYVPYDI
jgi:hypothetical protein